MTTKQKSAPKTAAKAVKTAATAARSAAVSPMNFGVGMWPSAGGFTSPTTPKTMESMMSKSQSQFDAFSKDSGAFVKEGVEALMKSGKICAERAQEMMSTYAQMYQDASEKQAGAFKNILSCKTMNDVSEFQSKYAQQNFDEMMSAFTKMTEMGIKFASEAFEPLNDQFGKAIKKATDSMAA